MTGLAYTRLSISLEEGLTNIAQQRDLVYLTTDRDLARAFASTWTLDGGGYGGGSLYRVEPDEAPQPDEDMLSSPGLSWQVRSATILHVYDAHVPFDSAWARRVFARVVADHEIRRRDADGR